MIKKISDWMETDKPIIIMWIAFIAWAALLIFWPAVFTSEEEPEVIVETKFVYIYEECNHVIEEEPEPEEEPEILSRYGFTDDDIYLMTVLLCGSGKTDGDGEYDVDFENYDDHDQISLVLSVVMNRVMSDKFPNTVSEVIWAPGQFSPMPKWRNGLPKVNERSYQIVKEWCEAYDKHDLTIMSIPESHLYFAGNGTKNRSRERW